MGVIEKLPDTQVTMLVLLAVGYVLARGGVISAAFRKTLTDFIIRFILPCSIVKSFLVTFDMQIMRACLAVVVLSVGTQLLGAVLGRLLYRRTADGRRQTLYYATQVSNAGLLGNPVAEGLYGPMGLLYASVYAVPLRILMWSAGVACFTGGREKGGLKKVLTHPCILAVCIGLVLMLTQLQLPGWVGKPLEMLSACNTPLSILVIGAVLAELDPKRVLDPLAGLYCGVRLVLIPLLVLAFCSGLGLEKLVVQVTVILAGMPAPLTTVMLASQYRQDESFAVLLVFLSTLGSMVTIPLLSLLMMG